MWRRICGCGRRAVFGVTAFALAAQPVLSPPPIVARPAQAAREQLAASSQEYLSSISEALRVGAGAIPLLQAIEATPREQLSDQAVAQARELLLEVADQSAVALGRVDDILESVEALGVSSLPAADLGQAVADGLPQGLRDSLLADLDLSPSQLDLVDATFRDALRSRQEVGASGLSEDVIALLREGGATQAQIDQIDAEVRSRGYADAGLSTRAEQLRASQDELAVVRLGANAANVRLIEFQVQARQARGIAPRAVTESELEELAKDELRLLVHVTHLQELWGEDPSLEVGEGDWWFVERYSTRAAERLADLTVDAQNLALGADLLILLEVRSLSVCARSGDADYVRSELDSLAAALAELGAGSGLVAREREVVRGVPGKLLAKLVTAEGLRERLSWPLATRDITAAEASIWQRMDRWETVASDPLSPALGDTNPSNDSLGALLVVGATFPEVIRALEFLHDYLAVASIATDFTLDFLALLVGLRDPSSTWEIPALVIVSFIPFLDLLNDLVTIVRVDDPFVVALATFGLAMTLVEMGALLPPLAPFGASAELPDAFVTGVRGAYLATDVADFRRPLNLLTDEQGFEMAGDLIGTAGVRMIDEGIPANVDGVARVLGAEFRTWDDFEAYVRAVGNRAEGVDLLVELGADEGSLLVGAAARHAEVGFELTVDQIRAVKRFGDDLFEAGVRLSDEAAAGITRTISDVGEVGVERVVNGLRHADGSLQAEQVEQALVLVGRAAFAWTEESLEGIGRSARLIGASGTQRLFDLGESAREAFAAVAVRGENIWDATTGEGLARVFQTDLPAGLTGGQSRGEYYLQALRTYDDPVSSDVLRSIGRADPDSGANILQRVTDPQDIFQWRMRGNSLSVLGQGNVFVRREAMTQAEYQALLQRIFNNWNDGQPMTDAKQLSEAFAMEAGADYLNGTGEFSEVLVRIRQNGIDGAALNTSRDVRVMLEGKGTYTGAELRLSSFSDPDIGFENSPDWLLADVDRHFTGIPNEYLAGVQELIDAVRRGDPYEVVVLRGGINGAGVVRGLEIGNGLDEYIRRVTPEAGSGFVVRFIFINVLGY